MFSSQDLFKFKELKDFLDLIYNQQPTIFMNYGLGQFWKLLKENELSAILIDDLYRKYNFDQEVIEIRDNQRDGNHVSKLLTEKTSDEYIALCLAIVKNFRDKGGNHIYTKTLQQIDLGRIGEREHHYFIDNYVRPIVLYIERNLNLMSNKVKLLKRYQLFCSNYQIEDLRLKKETEITRAHLPRFLFDSGIDYPLYETTVASGRMDVYNELNAIVIEAKLYTGDRKVVYQCISQAIARLNNFNFTDAYVVIFNQSKDVFDIQEDGSVMGVPYWLINQKYIFILVIDLNRDSLKDGETWNKSIKKVKILKTEYEDSLA